ncbi:MAG: hypothetical protein ACYC0X_16110 [Pirellulaceae bacterium]
MAQYLAVFFFAAIALVCETLLFHVTKYVLDYILAVAVISCAVAGIGLGAFLASRLPSRPRNAFGWCCGGTTVSLYLAAWVLLRWPDLFLLLPAIASVFICPSYFIARAFAQGSARGVYLFDMLGAGSAIGLTVLAYHWLDSEEIFLGVVTLTPLLGGLAAVPVLTWSKRGRLLACLALFALAITGGVLLHEQVTRNSLHIARLINPEAPNIPRQHLLRRSSRRRVEQTYDSLMGRLETVRATDRTLVTYDGFFNDNFSNHVIHDYAQYAKPHKIRLPSVDRRVVYGLVPEPRVFVIGSATPGILTALREITPVEKIEAVEVNPGVLQIMLHDYYDASGQAYRGVHTVLGNALSVLRRSDNKYDIITLINAHSSRWIGALGPPDYLHTRESYDLYFDHLTQDGYLLFEERPDTDRGELGVKRMIITLCDCLRRRGIEDPTQHFFIWEFMSHRYHRKGLTGIATGSDMYYVGMIVSLKPLVGPRLTRLLDWYNLEWRIQWDDGQPVHTPFRRLLEPAYLKDRWHGERFGPFFDRLARNDFDGVGEDFDASIVTHDRPFPSCSRTSEPEIWRALAVTSGICSVLGALFAVGALRGIPRRSGVTLLIIYNVAIGAAYFFVEIMLIQAYQGVFLSPSVSLVMVLGGLLIGSAVGGLLADRIALWGATLALVPVLALCLQVPSWTRDVGLNSWQSGIAAMVMIFVVGMNMGIYFPTGLLQVRQWSLSEKIPHLFAINAMSGSLATVVSLYLAIRVGYTWTLICAFVLYVAATVAYHAAHRIRPEL